MSIICIVHVPEGIVMGADGRVSYWDNNKIVSFDDTQKKLVIMELGNRPIGISHCGVCIFKNDTFEEYILKFKKELSVDLSIEIIAKVLQKKLENYKKDYGLFQETLFYVCGFDRDKAKIFLVKEDGVEELKEYKEYYKGFTSYAELFDTQEELSNTSLDDAVLKAKIIVSWAVKGQIEEEAEGYKRTCGGTLNIVIIEKNNIGIYMTEPFNFLEDFSLH